METKLQSGLPEFNPFSVLFLILLTISFLGVFDIYWDRKKNLFHLPGPLPLPLLGNALMFTKPHEFFMGTLQQLRAQYGGTLRIHLGTRANVAVTTPEGFEKILSSNRQITKGKDYKFLMPWLGTGLLTSTGAKWHSRRKLLTPSFHFRILEDFLQVMNQQTEKLCDILEPLSAGPAFDVFPLVTHCALDIICETAMGRSLNAQEDSDTDYVRAIYSASDIVFQRQRSPWLWSDLLFSLTPTGWVWRGVLDTLHTFTDRVIRERKAELAAEKDEDVNEDEVGVKRRLAFLDLLIEASQGGTVLSDADIREEVDTFLFEGHDTTATNMTFSLYVLAAHPDIQTRCQQELQEIFQGDDRAPTSQDLAKMKYLECCLKEALRLYQSVPIMSRTLGEDVEIDGRVIPAGTNAILCSFLLHRDPASFPDPDTFNPDR